MNVLITGATGSFGKAMTRFLLTQRGVKTIRLLSRDEYKQFKMQEEFTSPKLRYFVGDVRDEPRLYSAFSGVDVVIHAAAMKQVPACEYNPYEAVKTNIIGTQNVISACVKQRVSKALFISTDKAVDPINLYGATKLVAEKIWLNSNNRSKTRFSFTRWGNVLASRGSVIQTFEEQKNVGVLTITDKEMTRFVLRVEDAVKFAWSNLLTMKGGEIFIPELPSLRIIDLANVIAPEAKLKYVGKRFGEKLHETLAEGYTSNDPERLMTIDQVRKVYESI